MLSRLAHDKLIVELEYLETEELPACQIALEEAKSKGDLRENSEYDSAKEVFSRTRGRINDIKSLLKQGIRETDSNSTITLGKLLRIRFLGRVDSATNKIVERMDEEKILLYDTQGNSVIDGILTKDTRIGSLIDGGRPGKFSLSAGRTSILFEVEILGSEHHDAFIAKYPADKRKRVQALIAGDI